jgi:isocitrate dehydrogenase kinase/phosphatase
LLANWGALELDSVEIIRPVFYRGKGAYLVGRIVLGRQINPLILVLLNTDRGIVVDAVLLRVDEVSIVFSFTRSYFHVEVEIPHQLISFLKSIMPAKRVAEIYISIGYNKHGKTELYRNLLRHLQRSDDQFEIARGEKGMVMVVFTMPSYDVVFKVIRDRFADPKTPPGRKVMDRYQLVFKHDRAGRLVDAQEFEHLKFDRDRFSAGLIQELLATAGAQPWARIMSRSNIFIPKDGPCRSIFASVRPAKISVEAVLDYGQAIKDLAATNIFPGDIL